MRKDILNFIGLILIAIALYLGLSSMEMNVQTKVEIPSSEVETVASNTIVGSETIEKLFQDKLKAYQDWGYANGLIMAKRALRENEQFREWG